METREREAETIDMDNVKTSDCASKPELTLACDSYDLRYGVEDYTPVHISIIYGLQLVLANVSGPVVAVYVIHSLVCTTEADNLLFAELLSTSIFVTGIATFIQVTWGVRLPTIQSSSYTFLAPIAAMMATSRFKCPDCEPGISMNATDNTTGPPCEEEPWRSRLLEINGCLIFASLIHVFVGFTGIIGFLQSYIGPVTLCPTIALVGLTLFPSATGASQYHWGVAIFTAGLYVLFTVFMAKVAIPIPTWTRRKGCSVVHFPIFKVFPHMLAICGGWLLCLILTESGNLPDDSSKLSYAARTDSKLDVMEKSEWIFWPRPGYYGTITFGPGLFVGFIAVVLSSITESVGDYYAMAAVCALPTPPKHAVNRGILVEGISSVVSGLLGACHATTTYSDVVGMVAVTGVASRFTFQIASVMFVLFGIFGKFGAALSMIPEPVIGGIGIASFGLIVSVGVSFLSHCDMTSTRNLVIIGVSLMIGMMLPFHVEDNPGWIDTGNADLDTVITLFLGTGMFIGALLAFILDNIAPGTKEERGLLRYEADLRRSGEHGTEDSLIGRQTYDLPYVSEWMRRQNILSYVPFLPSYSNRNVCRRRVNKAHDTNGHVNTNKGYDSTQDL